MENITEAVAGNLRRIREQRKLSLDGLAALTGVSKSMLAQIERGQGNPTITTMWKIAGGLKISFTQLLDRPEQDAEVVDLGTMPVMPEDDGRYRNTPVFSYEEARPFEIYSIEMLPGARLEAEPHAEGTQEYLLVSEGVVEVTVDGDVLAADPGHAVRFRADKGHAYRNVGEGTCRLVMVISYVT